MKKKHILWVFLLTAVVATPPIYQRLSEAHRLKQIKTVKHEAAQINAIPLSDFLRQLKAISPQKTLLVLYTGSTEGHLEPCGCFIGQSGGLPRRATAISSIRAHGFSPLLVDIGGILPTKEPKMKGSVLSRATSPNNAVAETRPINTVHPLDRLRTQKVLESMRLLEYEALVPDKSDMNFGEDFVTDTLTHQEFPLLTANIEELEGNVQPVLMRTVSDKKVAILGLSSLSLQDTKRNVLERLLPKTQKQADFIVILSNLAPEVNRTIAENYQGISAILSHGTGETEKIGNVLLTYSGSNGETLGALLLNTDNTPGVSAQQIALTQEVEDDIQIRELLQDFYKQVADDPQLQAGGERLFSDSRSAQGASGGGQGAEIGWIRDNIYTGSIADSNAFVCPTKPARGIRFI